MHTLNTFFKKARSFLVKTLIFAMVFSVLNLPMPQAFAVGETGTISGTVTSGGSPVEGVEVNILLMSDSGPDACDIGECVATTDASGNYSISSIPVYADWSVFARKTGYLGSMSHEIPVTDGGTTDVDVSLTEGVGDSVSGTITDGTNPVEAFVIFFGDNGTWNMGNSSVDGYYSFSGLSAGTFFVYSGTDSMGYFNDAVVISSGSNDFDIILVGEPPQVVYMGPSNVMATSVDLTGTISSNGGSDITEIGFNYGLTTGYGDNVSATAGAPYTGNFTLSITGLACNTTYHWQAYAVNSSVTGSSSDNTFTTGACVSTPTVLFGSVTDVTTTSATLNGNITSVGSSSVIERGFNYGLTTSYGTNVSLTAGAPYTTGTYSSAISSLTCGTTYHYRSYAINSVGTNYSADANFSTSSCVGTAPTVSTGAATSITTTGVTLSGNITSTGSTDVIERGFEWGLSNTYGYSQAFTGSGPYSGGYSYEWLSAICGTTYHYRSYAINSVGTSYGNDVTFATAACEESEEGVGSIRGVVARAAGGIMLGGVSVTVNPGNYTTTTNGSGVFTVTDLTAGEYTVTVNSSGFTAQTQEGITVTSDNEASVSFSLGRDESGSFAVSEVKIYTDRIIVRFNHGAIDGTFDCSNYLIDGESPECMWGGGTAATGFNSTSAFEKKPFVEYMGDNVVIKNLEISGEVTFAIPADNGIKDGSNNFLEAYTVTATAEELSLPIISDITPDNGSVGDTITITGTNFGVLGESDYMGDDNHKVLFEAGWNQTTYQPNLPVEATYLGCTGGCSWGATQIKVKVPTGAKSGPLKVFVNGNMNDADYNAFFDVAGSYAFKVYYGQNDDTSTPMPDADAGNIRAHIGGMNGEESHYVGDGNMTYDTDSDTFTVAGVSSMGWTFAYDVTGAHLSSDGNEITTTETRNIFIPTSYRTISGTITLGSTCTSAGQNKQVVVFPSPQQVDFGSEGFKSTQPIFVTTNSECTSNYTVGVSTAGIYRMESHIPPDKGGTTVSASQFVDPDALTVTVNGENITGQNFTYTSATHKIVGTITKPSGSFGDDERDMLWVWAYQPRENGRGTGTQVNDDNTFTLYVTPGVWKVGVGGSNIQYPIEVSVEVDGTYAIDQPDKGPNIVIAPPSDFIEGYVKDANGVGLSNSSIYAWREGGSGGGNSMTNSDGYFKMYVQEGSNYHVGANAKRYGYLGEYTGINVSSSEHPTVNFVVSSSSFHAVSGVITKNGNVLQNAFVYVTEGEWGQGVASGGTDSSGVYSLTLPDGNNRYIHVGLPGSGDVYKASLGATSADATHNVTIVTSAITVRISPASLFDQAFVGADDPTNQTGSFSNTNVASGDASYKEYQIDVRRPSSGSNTLYVHGNIPGFGPLGEPESVTINSAGSFTESSGTANDGIIEYSLTGYQTVSGTVTGDNVVGAWIWAGGSNGGGGSPVNDDGTFSFKLKNGTYDIGVDKPGYIGGKTEITVSDEDITDISLTLTSASDTITGIIYYPTSSAASGARVWAENGSGGHAFAMSNADGTYTLNVTAGDWTVMAGHDGYYSDRASITAPATGVNITLVQDAGFNPQLKNEPIIPSDGGVVNGTGIKVNVPKNALGTGATAGTVEVKNTTNIPVTSRTKLVGTAKEITAKNESNQDVKNLEGEATIEFTLSRQDLIDENVDTIAEASRIEIYSWDDTANNWVALSTVATLNPTSAATIAELDETSAVTLTASTTHFSAFAPMLPTGEDAPDAPSNLEAAAGDASVTLTWDAVSGASKYYVYQKSGDVYPYLNETTSTSYTVSSLTNGTAYYFKVSAVSSGDAESSASGPVTATPVAAAVKGVTVTESSGSTAVAEGGATDTYTVVLDALPSATVTVAVSVGADVTVSPTSLSFTTGNWATPQTVTVTAVDDSTYEGAEVSTITHSATSSDTDYNGISISSVVAAVTDNESAPTGGLGGGYIANELLITEKTEIEVKKTELIAKEVIKQEVVKKNLLPRVTGKVIVFKDVPSSHWASDYIKVLAERGVLTGRAEAQFDPDDFVTRAELTKIVTTSFYSDIPGETDTPFIDVKFNKWYAPYIKFAYEKGIVKGASDNRLFRPDDFVTRAEAIKMVLSAAGTKLAVDVEAAFTDIDYSAWYMPYLNYATVNNIISGYKDGAFAPEGRITRAEVSKIVAKLIEMNESK
ncbi:MAG: hypothetical protein US89_C0008G0013 [Candidatus Peregrinibacteria bacterium GW2011_GWF2_38_29]|nr:MAG: hypothetical protein US89_C0008G0013 [Candidatus Peregrinibacteria bacterium GW2011_GWF2_38_29]HBB03175.1 hypothetical protein [Candidatus Peregrinibacteria bacterium]